MVRLVSLFLLATPMAQAQSPELIGFAGEILVDLQSESFEINRELCGTIGFDESGALVASVPVVGDTDSCLPEDPEEAVEVVASYHTHGAWSPEYDAELPSPDDVYGDMEEALYGFVSTPGGRFWLIDWTDGFSRQLCRPGCQPIDNRMPVDHDQDIPETITLEALEAWFE